MRTFPKMIVQALAILLIASAAGLLVNALRPDGLGLLEAGQSAVAANRENGEIGIKDATELFASGRGLFLDARTPWEFEAGRIQGALSLPPDEFDFLFPELEERLRSAEALITYCDGERCPLGNELARKSCASAVSTTSSSSRTAGPCGATRSSRQSPSDLGRPVWA
jgi:hypothetical protein